MIHEGDLIPRRRNTNMADPSTALIQHVADGVLKSALAIRVVDHRQAALSIPVGPAHIREQVTRSSSRERSACQHAARRLQLTRVRAADHNRQLVAAGNRQQTGVSEFQRLRKKRVADCSEQLYGLVVPCSTVDDGLSVGSKPRRVNRSSLERQATISRRRNRSTKQCCKPQQNCRESQESCQHPWKDCRL